MVNFVTKKSNKNSSLGWARACELGSGRSVRVLRVPGWKRLVAEGAIAKKSAIFRGKANVCSGKHDVKRHN